MQTAHGNLHLEIQTTRKSPVGLLRTSFRDHGKMRHTQHGRITGCSLEQLKLLQLAFRERVVPVDDPQAFQILNSREVGASHAIVAIAKQLGLHRILYSRTEPWVNSALAMIVGRLVYAGSKLALCNHHPNTCLWEMCGIDEAPDVEANCYEPMDRLLQRQKAIQKALAGRHLRNGQVILYDITSVYFEGDYKDSDLVTFGYNRDGKKSREQIVVGLICNDQGCPVGVEVYAGNTKDETTVVDKVHEIKQCYGIAKVIFVGDRGMVTRSTIDKLKDEKDLQTIGALTHGEMMTLLKNKVITLDLFDERSIHEVSDPDEPTRRYCLCRNPQTAVRESQTRQRLLDLTTKTLTEIAAYKRATTVEKLGARVGKVLAKYKLGKFIQWAIEADPQQEKSCQHRLTWSIKTEKVEHEKRFDGCYVITSDVDKEQMKTLDVVRAYKSLTFVERAFRNLKTVQLEIRPVYHKTDDRIRSHVFLCMLAYYLQWHMEQRLAPLFANDGEGKDRRWTFRGVIDCLAQITRNRVTVNGTEFDQKSIPTPEQEQILELLQVTM
ncbi:Transposase [Thiorhodovibrio winogradskyi]|uniref:Transposase n=1 Tax=Thiorhodovibrio winogradskyi TaxID=77007 RepID=A0ABZ0SAP1_9GAMM|nr:IS1634 family transposase [Thiorhodovibrio winogradskyi]